MFGAALAIIGGNVASILAGYVSRRLGASSAYSIASTGLGIFGLSNLALLQLSSAIGVAMIPFGNLERGSVYSITAWEIMTGLTIIGTIRNKLR